jgi:hypothetical protein
LSKRVGRLLLFLFSTKTTFFSSIPSKSPNVVINVAPVAVAIRDLGGEGKNREQSKTNNPHFYFLQIFFSTSELITELIHEKVTTDW